MKNQDDFFEIKLSEAKDLLIHINDSIRETRNRIFFLIVLILSTIGFCVEDILNAAYLTTKSIMLYSAVLLGCYVIFQCRRAITPLELRFNGISPKSFDKITNKVRDYTHQNLLHTYQRSIEINGDHLKMIAKAYNRAFYALLIWLFLVFCFLTFKWII